MPAAVTHYVLRNRRFACNRDPPLRDGKRSHRALLVSALALVAARARLAALAAVARLVLARASLERLRARTVGVVRAARGLRVVHALGGFGAGARRALRRAALRALRVVERLSAPRRALAAGGAVRQVVRHR